MSLAKRLSARADRIREYLANNPIGTWFVNRKNEPPTEVSTVLKDNASVREGVTDVLEQLRAEVASITADGSISFSEVVQFAFRACKLFYTELQTIAGLEPETRKQVVMYSLDEFYTTVIAPLDIPYVPQFFESSIIDPVLGKLWHQAADGIYESVEATLNGE